MREGGRREEWRVKQAGLKSRPGGTNRAWKLTRMA